MLTNVLRTLIYEPVLETFLLKIDKVINFYDSFYTYFRSTENNALSSHIHSKVYLLKNKNVNCHKSINLGTIFRNMLLEIDKAINFYDNFLYFS